MIQFIVDKTKKTILVFYNNNVINTSYSEEQLKEFMDTYNNKDVENDDDKFEYIKNIFLGNFNVSEEAVKSSETLKVYSKFTKNILKDDRFYEEDGLIYFKESNIAVPFDLAEVISNAMSNNENYEKFINFWRWCSLNPDADSAKDLFNFVLTEGVDILPSGLLLLFRRVVSKYENTALKQFVLTQYGILRAKHRSTDKDIYTTKNAGEYSFEPTTWTANTEYWVDDEDGDGDEEGEESMGYWEPYEYEVKSECVGNLKELYAIYTSDDDGEVWFTDNHTKKMKYKIGVEARMDRSEVDPDKRNSCSTGFHAGSHKFSFSGFGDVPVAVVINPADVLVTLKNEHGKIRTAAFTIVGVLSKDAAWHDDKEIINNIENTVDFQLDKFKKLYQKETNFTNAQEERAKHQYNIENVKSLFTYNLNNYLNN